MSQKKERYSIKTHLCTYSDFYNKSTIDAIKNIHNIETNKINLIIEKQ